MTELADGVDLQYNFQNLNEMKEIRDKLLKRYDEHGREITHGVGAPFNTNILKIALNAHEEVIA